MMVTDPDPISATTINDADIQQEIIKAITHLGLPAPDGNSVYVMLFPPGLTIIAPPPNGSSCVDFCAYHGNFMYGQLDIPYSVTPDQGGNCAFGCGLGNKLQNTEESMSHEFAEFVTDPGGQAAWYDLALAATDGGGEIADLCVNPRGDTVTVSGQTVQKLWSNMTESCIGVLPPGGNDYSVTATPAAASVALGATTTVQITTKVSLGAAEPINLTVSGQSNGLTATIAPTTINSGGSATLTLTAAAGADQVRAAVDVNAAVNAEYSHDALVTVTVGTPGDFSLSLTPTSQNVMAGASATYTVNVGVVSQPVGDVTLTAVNVAAGLHATFNPATVTPGGTSTLTLDVADDAGGGTQRFQVQGALQATVHTVTGSAVVAVPDAAVFDAKIFPDAKSGGTGSTGNTTPAGSCAIATAAGHSGGAGILTLGLLAGVAFAARRRFASSAKAR